MKIEISHGEIVDKATILLIKSNKIDDPAKLKNIQKELEQIIPLIEDIEPITGRRFSELLEINERLWNIEDDIRRKESLGQFDSEFIELARSVYFTNDSRAKIKREINELSNSKLIEEKSYEKY